MDPVTQPRRAMVVTIDGPAGSGKTTVSKLLARRLGYRYLDTGALYRAVAVAVQQSDANPDDDTALAALCGRIHLDLQETADGARVLLDGKDITGALRAPAISLLASTISARPVVRTFLLETQRTLGAQKSLVAEGRDMGTVVFPHAEAKFYLDADPRIRARRRFEELQAAGSGPSLTVVEQEMVQRDRNDTTRSVSPLKPAADAIRIDASDLTAEQVVGRMLERILPLA
ncbi:MAG: (d)CMP kinase [Desulfatitalea sp.]|nr:(d)CMP kinase [Desulfatitalea sp.]